MYKATNHHNKNICDFRYKIFYFTTVINIILLLLCPVSIALNSGDDGIQAWLSGLISFANTGSEMASKEMIVSVSKVEPSDVIVDVMGDQEEYIYGAVNISYKNFLEKNNTLKPLPVIAKILGEAGISRNDSVVLYGKCLPCGSGPAFATFVCWIMKYAGHDKVRVLDGDLDAWKEAGRPTQDKPSVRSRTVYDLSPRLELLANYTYVSSGKAQLIDARTQSGFLAGTIPGSVNIPYDEVIDGDRIKSKSDLERIFSGIDNERPVVVYTSTGIKSSVVWFALTSLGYDTRLYSYMDWYNNRGLIYSPATGLTNSP